ncbi:diphthine--ammonia ligase [Desertibacillus haloalkaliphilus]|uniref:Dph6-related ATP pyrophosphatase n=1 Tax=Desertibacillus haloalkaliphilus TaxID=1328930 RepID=UPI001C277EBF|nr:diphthine--ammonia ligase [Desertibacillus haloalkaliphilus]MBU8906155.1 diphthine--ammonia ligase [Desertibacillus haloalkaliphilus]
MKKNTRKKVAICWSGGKDSCLALYRVLKENHEVSCLLSMVSEKDARNHAHGIQLEVLKLQADALGLPLVLVDSAEDYESSLQRSLSLLKKQSGVEAIVFGSLYSNEDRRWNEQIALKSGIEPLFPIWISKKQTSKLLHEFVSLGFNSVVCRASTKFFDRSWAGKYLDWNFYDEIHQTDCCVMGEYGEYHTFVLDGPIFKKKIDITKSSVVMNSGLWSLDIQSCELVDK